MACWILAGIVASLPGRAVGGGGGLGAARPGAAVRLRRGDLGKGLTAYNKGKALAAPNAYALRVLEQFRRYVSQPGMS